MYCKKCGKKAFTRIQYARMNLCRDHFIEFFHNRIESTVKRYHLFKAGERLLIAVSGGKDSIALLYAITTLYRDKNEISALFINLGIPIYSDISENIVKSVCERLNIPLIIYNLKEEIGKTLPEIHKESHRKICSICGVIKRYIINKIAYDNKFDVVLTGHTMDDHVAFAMKHLLIGDISSFIRLSPKTQTDREMKLIGRAKPLYETYEKETILYCIANELPFVSMSCPFSTRTPVTRWKFAANELEKNEPGLKIRIVRTAAKKLIPFFQEYTVDASKQQERKLCKICGMPTSSDICAFCRLTKREEVMRIENRKK
ncbi:MAG: ATP-binding protein [Candidatus Asgardarchaeia archaeon]